VSDLNGLSDEEQWFMTNRYYTYLGAEYDEDFFGSQDGRSRTAWAHDKAWDDVINIGEFEPKLLGWNELTEKEQWYMRRRYYKYTDAKHDEEFGRTHDGHGRKKWAHDKAWDDLVSMSVTVKYKHRDKMKSCVCSAYDNDVNDGRVRAFECVLDGSNKTPCYYVLMPEDTFYDDKTHRIELAVRTLLWRLRHPFYRRRHNK